MINILTQAAEGDNPAIGAPTSATFKIEDTYDNNFLEQLKSGFKRTIKWNKYRSRSEMTNQTTTNH